MFAIMWAWVNFTWFASAYDTDDWLFRVMTMVQMVGVLIVAMGVPTCSPRSRQGAPRQRVLVGGYVIMRVAMVLQWLRAAQQDPRGAGAPHLMSPMHRRRPGRVGWPHRAQATRGRRWLLMLPLYAIELVGPYIAERDSSGTPWHAHHIAERYSLIVIIALGECLVGTVAALRSSSMRRAGRGGGGCRCGRYRYRVHMWWIYFVAPWARVCTTDAGQVPLRLRPHRRGGGRRRHGCRAPRRCRLPGAHVAPVGDRES